MSSQLEKCLFCKDEVGSSKLAICVDGKYRKTCLICAQGNGKEDLIKREKKRRQDKIKNHQNIISSAKKEIQENEIMIKTLKNDISNAEKAIIELEKDFCEEMEGGILCGRVKCQIHYPDLIDLKDPMPLVRHAKETPENDIIEILKSLFPSASVPIIKAGKGKSFTKRFLNLVEDPIHNKTIRKITKEFSVNEKLYEEIEKLKDKGYQFKVKFLLS